MKTPYNNYMAEIFMFLKTHLIWRIITFIFLAAFSGAYIGIALKENNFLFCWAAVILFGAIIIYTIWDIKETYKINRISEKDSEFATQLSVALQISWYEAVQIIANEDNHDYAIQVIYYKSRDPQFIQELAKA